VNHPHRRRVLIGLAAGVGAASLSACSSGGADVVRFDNIGQAVAAIEAARIDGKTARGWSLAEVLNHVAQGIEYSVGDGFPQMKSALFRHTVGSVAFAVFDGRGHMSHPLDEPIPGAPPLSQPATLQLAADRCVTALGKLQAFSGTPHPHFAYGTLSREQNQRAHLMHLANHWSLLVQRA
jgi:hypothetical protein